MENNNATPQGEATKQAADLQQLFRQFKDNPSEYKEPLFAAVLRHALKRVEGDDDAAQEVAVTVHRVHERLDPERFEHYLNKLCRNARRALWRKRAVERAAVEYDDDESRKKEEVSDEGIDAPLASCLVDNLCKLPGLDAKDRRLLSAMRKHGGNQAAVARELKVTRQRIGQRWKLLRDKLRELASQDSGFRCLRNREFQIN